MRSLGIIALLAFTGCEPALIALPEAKSRLAVTPLATEYDADAAGTIEGMVDWNESIPRIAPIQRPLGGGKFQTTDNPNALRIADDGGIAGAIVMLRGVDPAKSKPWPFPPVEVELLDRGITVHPGVNHGRAGFVRRGDTVTFRTNGDKTFGLRARGASFFALMLPPNQPRTERILNQEGRIDLASASGQYWASASLYVCDHPYYAVTDATGRFRLENVPAGQYELVVEHPNWNVTASEIDPESGLLARQTYAPAIQRTMHVSIEPKKTTIGYFGLPWDLPAELR